MDATAPSSSSSHLISPDCISSNPLQARNSLTDEYLADSPYNPELWYRRAIAHEKLGYPELAIGDCYRALLLVDEILEFEDGSEFGTQAVSQWRSLRTTELGANEAAQNEAVQNNEKEEEEGEDQEDQEPLSQSEQDELQKIALNSRRILCASLIPIGCLLDATEQAAQALKFHPDDEELIRISAQATKLIDERRKANPDVTDYSLRKGEVARIIYDWNKHEPDRTSADTVEFLDSIVKEASMGNFTVKVTELPVLVPDKNSTDTEGREAGMHLETVKQLGVYAAKDLPADTQVFRERSILTVNNRLFDTLCDCCSGRLPESSSECFSCPECDEVAFCSQLCLDEAMEKYHPTLCGRDLDFLFKSSHSGFHSSSSPMNGTGTSSNAAASLYTLLLLKALAMSLTQEVHILDILPIKYLYGSSRPPPPPEKSPTLPFTFADNILSVFHLLTRLEVDPYVVSLKQFDIWHTLTIHSKILGTASARHDTRSGAPEVAALHLCYSLVNHDCAPCLKWECKSEMVFTTLREVEEGEEVRDSYTDIRLDWRERREWLMGTLGGGCRCARCVREEAEEAEGKQT